METEQASFLLHLYQRRFPIFPWQHPVPTASAPPSPADHISQIVTSFPVSGKPSWAPRNVPDSCHHLRGWGTIHTIREPLFSSSYLPKKTLLPRLHWVCGHTACLPSWWPDCRVASSANRACWPFPSPGLLGRALLPLHREGSSPVPLTPSQSPWKACPGPHACGQERSQDPCGPVWNYCRETRLQGMR